MSENQFPESSSNESVSHGNETIINSSITTSLGEMIRLNLPIIGNHLKRLIGLKSYRSVSDEASEVLPENTSETFTIETEPPSNLSSPLTISIQSFNLYDLWSSEIPSISRPSSSADDGGSDRTISTIMSPPESPIPLMISNGVNTSPHIMMTSVVNNDGVIITGNPTDFAAALNARMGRGIDDESEVPFEPRRVPLLPPSEESRSYAISSPGIYSSSSSGSWSSAEADDVGTQIGESELFRRRQNEARQFYDNVPPRQSVRKQFRHHDDDSPLY